LKEATEQTIFSIDVTTKLIDIYSEDAGRSEPNKDDIDLMVNAYVAAGEARNAVKDFKWARALATITRNKAELDASISAESAAQSAIEASSAKLKVEYFRGKLKDAERNATIELHKLADLVVDHKGYEIEKQLYYIKL